MNTIEEKPLRYVQLNRQISSKNAESVSLDSEDMELEK